MTLLKGIGGDNMETELELVAIIEGLQDIDIEKRTLYLKLATLFENDLKHNLVKDHIQLAEETGLSHALWSEFLNITEVNGFMDSNLNVIARASQRKRLAQMGKGASASDINAYKALKEHNVQYSDVDNSNVVVMYIDKDDR